MKFLLTSNGLSNQSIANALFELVDKNPSETHVAFVPTAMNPEEGNKDWFINDLKNLLKQGFKEIDIVDISALPKDIWLPRLETVEVLFFSGGNTTHLMYWLNKSGLAELLPEMLKTKVWAGISAGSMVTNPTLALSNQDKKIYYEERFNYRSEEALGFVDLYVRPHFNSPHFSHAREEVLTEIAKGLDVPLYALDDQSALKITNGEVKVVSEGSWLKL